MGIYIIPSVEVSLRHCDTIPEITTLKEERFIWTQVSEEDAHGCSAL